MNVLKTNAMRILDKANIAYDVLTYPHNEEAIDGVEVAHMLQQDPNAVFKTLVTIANTKEYYVFLVPVAHELDLKKCANAVGVKRVEMIHVKDINKITGYVRGGCSPIAMRKNFTTTIHHTCLQYPNIMFSGGKIGLQIITSPKEIIRLLQAQTDDIIK